MKSMWMAAVAVRRPFVRRARVGAGREDRHLERSVRRLCRLWRQILGRGRARWRSRILAARCSARRSRWSPADHQNKPDLATAIARRWYDTEGVDMITELTTSSVALAVQELSKEKKKIDIVVGAATSRIIRRCLHALQLPLGLRHPRARGRHRRRAGQSGRRYLVLPHRRLRLRLCAGKGHQRDRHRQWRQGAGLGARAAELVGLLLLPAAGAELEGQDRRPRQCRPRYHAIRSSRPPSSASSRAARSSRAC